MTITEETDEVSKVIKKFTTNLSPSATHLQDSTIWTYPEGVKSGTGPRVLVRERQIQTNGSGDLIIMEVQT